MENAVTISYLALGSNLGDRLGALRAAVRALAGHSELRIDLTQDVTSLYETTPVGGPARVVTSTLAPTLKGVGADPPYLNSVLRAQTSLTPSALLAVALSIEDSLGRTRQSRWEARVIDIDLLFVGDAVIDTPVLTLPHPRMHERRFVLEPLSELAADLIHPLTGVSIGELARRLRRDRKADVVTRIMGTEWACSA